MGACPRTPLPWHGHINLARPLALAPPPPIFHEVSATEYVHQNNRFHYFHIAWRRFWSRSWRIWNTTVLDNIVLYIKTLKIILFCVLFFLITLRSVRKAYGRADIGSKLAGFRAIRLTASCNMDKM